MIPLYISIISHYQATQEMHILIVFNKKKLGTFLSRYSLPGLRTLSID